MDSLHSSVRVGALRPGDPRQVGGIELVGLLGEGGMGRVYLGRSRGGRRVAVKVIRPEYAGQANFRERFAREVEAARRVGGFHTVPVVDADPYADEPWMATAFVDGPSLQAEVDARGVLSQARLARLGAQLTEGLATVHACGLIHRDLKPSNVLLAADGPRIIDFGIARAAGDRTLTAAGTLLGTVEYMSPEQVGGTAVTSASDVFSLAAVLVFAATGRAPFTADSLPAVLHAIAHQEPDLSGVPAALLPVIAPCLCKDPADRPDLDDVLARCAAIADLPGPGAPPAGPASATPQSAQAVDADPPMLLADTSTSTDHTPGPIPGADATVPADPGGLPGQVTPESGTPGVHPPRSEQPVRRRALLAAGATAVVAAAAVPAVLLRGGTRHATGQATTTASPPRTGTPPPVRLRLTAGGTATVGAGVNGATLSPDGSKLAAVTQADGDTNVWLLETATMRIRASTALGYGANLVTFAPDGGSLVVFGFGGHPEIVNLWVLEPGSLHVVRSGPAPGVVTELGSVAVSPDGSRLAVAGDHTVSVADAGTLHGLKSAAVSAAGGSAAAVFSPDGRRITVGGSPGNGEYLSVGGPVRVLDAATLATLATTTVNGIGAYSLAHTPDGRQIVMVGNASVILLDAGTLRTLATAPTPGGPGVTAAKAAGVTPDGRVLAGCSSATDVTAWLLDLATLTTVASTTVGPAKQVQGLSAALSADGRTLALGYSSEKSLTGQVQTWRISA